MAAFVAQRPALGLRGTLPVSVDAPRRQVPGALFIARTRFGWIMGWSRSAWKVSAEDHSLWPPSVLEGFPAVIAAE